MPSLSAAARAQVERESEADLRAANAEASDGSDADVIAANREVAGASGDAASEHDFLAAHAEVGATPPSPRGTYPEGPASMTEQVARGVDVPRDPVPTDIDARETALWQDAHTRAEWDGRTEAEAIEDANNAVAGIRHQTPQGDQSQLGLSPMTVVDAGLDAVAAAEPANTLTGHAARALSAQRFGPNGQIRAPYRRPKNAQEVSRARVIATDTYHRGGLSWDEAKAKVDAEDKAGRLLLPTADAAQTATAQTTVHTTTTPLIDDAGQGIADLNRGIATVGTDAADLLKDVADAGAAPVELAYRALGADTQARLVKEWRETPVPDLYAQGADWLASSKIPSVAAYGAKAKAAVARRAGVVAGAAELLGIDPDPATSPILARVLRVGLSEAVPRPGSVPSGPEVLTNEAGRIGALSDAMYQGDATPGQRALNVASGTIGVATGPLMDTIQAASFDPDLKETTFGRYLRVIMALPSGLLTTAAGRGADAFLTGEMGAESYRQNRVPEGPPPAWATLPGMGVVYRFAQDYLTSVENGDSLTSETMRTLDTATLGRAEHFTPEELALWRAGGSDNNFWVSMGMLGDLLIPLDHLPLAALHEGVGRPLQFVEGVRAGVKAGIGGYTDPTVLGLGAAWAVPSLTHRFLRGTPEYDAALTAVREGAHPNPLKPPSSDVDAPTVLGAQLYRWARREGEKGRSLADKGSIASATSAKMREILTTLRVTPEAIEKAVGEPSRQIPLPTEPPAEAVASPPRLVEQTGDLWRTALAKDAPPLGTWDARIDALPEGERPGAKLVQVAAHLGVPVESLALHTALQAALSTYDVAGHLVRAELPVGDAIGRLAPAHLDAALDRLKNAAPDTIWEQAVTNPPA